MNQRSIETVYVYINKLSFKKTYKVTVYFEIFYHAKKIKSKYPDFFFIIQNKQNQIEFLEKYIDIALEVWYDINNEREQRQGAGEKI